MQCPNCRSLQRGNALRCWKCGLDLTRPFDPAARVTGPAAATAPAAARAAAPVGPGAEDEPGPAPWGFLRRTFDPRIPEAELARGARFHPLIPWVQTYHKPAGVSLLVPVAVVAVARPVLTWIAPIPPYGTPNLYALVAWVSQILLWSVVGVLFVAYRVYQGSQAAMWIAMGVWALAILGPLLGLAAFGFWSPVGTLVGLLILYVQIVLLWKAAFMANARAEALRRDVERHLV